MSSETCPLQPALVPVPLARLHPSLQGPAPLPPPTSQRGPVCEANQLLIIPSPELACRNPRVKGKQISIYQQQLENSSSPGGHRQEEWVSRDSELGQVCRPFPWGLQMALPPFLNVCTQCLWSAGHGEGVRRERRWSDSFSYHFLSALCQASL